MELLKSCDSSLDGLEVGHHTTQPSSVYIVSTCTGSLFLDGISSLLLGAYEENFAAVSSYFVNEVVSLVELSYGFLQVNDVDAVSLSEDIGSHLRVPSSCLVTEMYTCFEKLLHRYYCHLFFLLILVDKSDFLHG